MARKKKNRSKYVESAKHTEMAIGVDVKYQLVRRNLKIDLGLLGYRGTRISENSV